MSYDSTTVDSLCNAKIVMDLVFFFLAENKGVWLNGFFDRGSFVETLDGWAKTVVCGRAR